MSARRSPASVALADPAGRRALVVLAGLAGVKAVGLILIAEALARGVVGLAHGTDLRLALACGVLGALLRAGVVWAQRAVGARAAVTVKRALRGRLLARSVSRTQEPLPLSDGALALTATRSLDELDDYYTTVMPALAQAFVIPLVVGVRILVADPVSAVVLILTIPLVPVFMVMIGRHTQDRVANAMRSLDQLSRSLVELARGLPVLIGLGRVRAQTKSLAQINDSYRRTTMQTLRTAFMSALALELIASLSVAVVAVFIGVRLVSGSMDLEPGLLVLILAPDVFLPLRQVGSAFHAAENGMANRDRIEQLLSEPEAADRGLSSGDRAQDTADAPSSSPAIEIDNLRVQWATAQSPVIEGFAARFGAGLSVLTGASGVGKSTVLHLIDQTLRDSERVSVHGELRGLPDRIVVIPQAPRAYAHSVRDELCLYADQALDSHQVESLLQRVDLHVPADTACDALSPGELRRLAVARALACVEAGAQLVLADEPTAHLDGVTASTIRSLLSSLAHSVPVIAATHDPVLIDQADAQIRMVGRTLGAVEKSTAAQSAAGETSRATWAVAALPGGRGASARESGASVLVHEPTTGGSNLAHPQQTSPADAGSAQSASTQASPVQTSSTQSRQPQSPSAQTPSVLLQTPSALSSAGQDGTSLRVVWRRLRAAVDMTSPAFLVAVLTGAGAAAAATSLMSLSAWLIVRASEQPPILYLLTAIVGVRFFGLARAVLTYVKQLSLHSAILRSLSEVRVRMWETFAAQGTANRVVLNGQRALGRLIADLDDIRDTAPRVVLSPLVGVVVGLGAMIAVALIEPVAGLVLAVLAVFCLFAAPALTRLADAHSSRERITARASVLDAVTRLLWAREDLIGSRQEQRVIAQIAHADSTAQKCEEKALRASGVGESLITAACVLAAVAVLAVLEPSAQAGELHPGLVAAAALIPLSLVDPFIDVVHSVQNWPGLRSVLARVDELDDPTAPSLAESEQSEGAGPNAQAVSRVNALALTRVSARWPAMDHDVFTGLSARVSRGQWLGVTGPSGSGKTTLVSVLLRFLTPRTGEYRINEVDALELSAEDLGGAIAWCPQEAHVFDSTIRANLLLSRPADDAPSEQAMREALTRVGLRELVDERGFDGRLGAGGSLVSGGQRQRLAVARTLLSGASCVVLDEPTAHLDKPTALHMMNDLRSGLTDSAVVLVTHDPQILEPSDASVRIGA